MAIGDYIVIHPASKDPEDPEDPEGIEKEGLGITCFNCGGADKDIKMIGFNSPVGWIYICEECVGCFYQSCKVEVDDQSAEIRRLN